MNEPEWDFIVIGGGAAGFFGAIACTEAKPSSRVLILEATGRVLTKVKISGGGRCNVTHHQFDPKKLVNSYPRGQKELLGPFYRFQPKDTVDWFANHGVNLKVESDGRMFPVSDNSQTIIDCLESAALNSGVVLKKNTLVKNIAKTEDFFEIKTQTEVVLKSKSILLATGSMPYGVKLAADLGHKLVEPVPSLFTFEIKDPLIDGLPGISFPQVSILLKTKNNEKEFTQEGPCLITHWGLSGPAVLKLSAFAARELHASAYQATIKINWQGSLKLQKAVEQLESLKKLSPQKKVTDLNPFTCVKRFWEALVRESGIDSKLVYAELSKKQLQELAERLTKSILKVTGKGVFKEEFVTAGGVSREEIDFRTMESKLISGLYFAGEVLDIDGITGGFNFQNAWSGAWIAGNTIASKL